MSASGDATGAERRAQLEALAYGPGVPAAEAAAARASLETLALAARPAPVGLESRVRRRTGDEPTSDAGSGSETSAGTAPGANAAPSEPTAIDAPSKPEQGFTRTSSPDAPDTSDAVSEPTPARVFAGTRAVRVGVGAAGVAVITVAAFLGGLSTGHLTATTHPTASATSHFAASDQAGDGFEPTIGELLGVPQTYTDQLPGALSAPVDLESTRLIFTNRSLHGNNGGTPWNVYAAVGKNPSLICVIATPDELTATEACYPRNAALGGNISLVAQSTSETLTLQVQNGAISAVIAPKH